MSDALWHLQELLEAVNGRLEGQISQPINGISIDSRAIAPGDLFVAIQGDARDGHEFVVAALQNGAAAAMVSKPDAEMRAAGGLIVVDEPLAGLIRLGEAARARSHARIVAITGSVGKTSTKEALLLALGASGKTHVSAASYNNHWGVPLSLARLPRDAQFAVFEIGMNHAGEIEPLVQMVKPELAIITTIAPSHLGNFDNLQGIAEAKAEIFSGVIQDGAVLLNGDNEFFSFLKERAKQKNISRIYEFGRSEAANVSLRQLKLHGECSCMTLRVFGLDLNVKIGVPGEHIAFNSLAVLGAVELLGADLALAGLAMAKLSPPNGRGVRHKCRIADGQFTLIDESYNANPTSMAAALQVLAVSPSKQGRRIAVLGDMLELGDQAAALHGDLVHEIERAGVDVVYACGPLMRNLWDGLSSSRRGIYAPESRGLLDGLMQDLASGDVVMIKGSHGSKMGLIVNGLLAQFPPVDEA